MAKKKEHIPHKLNDVLGIMPKKQKKPDMEYGPIKIQYEEIPKQSGKIKITEKGESDKTEEHFIKREENEEFKFERNQRYFSICVYALGTIAVAALIIYLVMNISSIIGAIKGFIKVITPFLAAFFIAFILNPLVKWLERIFLKVFHIQRTRIRVMLSILISYMIVIGVIAIAINYVVPQITNGVNNLIGQKDIFYNGVVEFLENMEKRFDFIDFQYVEKQLQSLLEQLPNIGMNLATDMVTKILNLGISIVMVVINLLLSVAISIYMLYDKRVLSKMLVKIMFTILPVKHAMKTTETLKECGKIFTGFVVGKSIDSLIIGILCFILMTIFKWGDYAVLLSLIVGVTNMIPYFGPFIGAVPGIILFLCINPLDAVLFAIMILGLQQFDGWILGPLILGESTGLTPLWVIFAITVGGAYGGVIGMFLGVPIVAVIAYLMNRFIDGKLKQKKIDIN